MNQTAHLILIWLFFLSLSCESSEQESEALGKILFSLETIDDNGLTGPPDGKRAITYEFCIPKEMAVEVSRIDPTAQYLKAKGRVGCSREEFLCLGNTHQPNYKYVLIQLAELEYVKEIKEAHFE